MFVENDHSLYLSLTSEMFWGFSLLYLRLLRSPFLADLKFKDFTQSGKPLHLFSQLIMRTRVQHIHCVSHIQSNELLQT